MHFISWTVTPGNDDGNDDGDDGDDGKTMLNIFELLSGGVNTILIRNH